MHKYVKAMLLTGILFYSQSIFAAKAVIISDAAKLRKEAEINSEVITEAPMQGSIVELLNRTDKTVTVGNTEGRWVEIQVDSQLRGWIFNKYLVEENSVEAKNYIQSVITSLYYYRRGVPEAAKKLEQTAASSIFGEIQSLPHRDLNYVGYHLLAQKNKRAIPLLIEFMNPGSKGDNSEDANYKYIWIALQMLIGDRFVIEPSTDKDFNSVAGQWYQQYRSWWIKNGDAFSSTASESTILSIFAAIKLNEDKKYRQGW